MPALQGQIAALGRHPIVRGQGRWRALRFAMLSAAFLLYMLLSYDHFYPAELRISLPRHPGAAAGPASPSTQPGLPETGAPGPNAEQKYFLQLDTGHGFNAVETTPLRPGESGGLSVELPQVWISSLRVIDTSGAVASPARVAVRISGPKERRVALSAGAAPRAGFPGAAMSSDRLGHPLRLVSIQIGLAIVFAAMAFSVGWLLPNLRPLFSNRHFLLGFLLVAVPRLVWLVGEWPAAMDADSLISWGESRSLAFANWHPYTHALYFLALRHIADSPATVALFQILAFALLAGVWASMVGSKVRDAAFAPRWSRLLIGGFYAGLLWFSLSVPSIQYSVTLTKDIPFSLALLFLTTVLFRAALPSPTAERAQLSASSVFVCAVFFLMAISVRHNGLYLLLWPVAYYFVARTARTTRRQMALAALGAAVFHLGIAPFVFGLPPGQDPIRNLYSTGELISGYANHPDGLHPSKEVAAALERFQQAVNYPINNGYSVVTNRYLTAYRKAGPEGAADVEILLDYLRRAILHNPSILIANRFYTLVSYFLPNPKARGFYKNHMRIPWQDGRMLAHRPHLWRTYDFTVYRPWSEAFSNWQAGIIAARSGAARRGTGLLGYLNGRMGALILLVSALVVWSFCPTTALVAAFYVLGVLSIVAPSSVVSYRLVAFLIPCLFLIPAGLAVECAVRSRLAPGNGGG